jgi:hypothetical protein
MSYKDNNNNMTTIPTPVPTGIVSSGRKVKYLNNRDLLAEIHRSKSSFSSFTSPEYSQHDIILSNLDNSISI